MRTVWRIPLFLGWILICHQASGAYSVLEQHQNLTTYNLQSQRGVPISTVAGAPPGSDSPSKLSKELKQLLSQE